MLRAQKFTYISYLFWNFVVPSYALWRVDIPQARRFCDRNLANKRSSRISPRRVDVFSLGCIASLFNEMSFLKSAKLHSYTKLSLSLSFSWRCASETPFIRPSRRFDIESGWSRRWRDIYQVVASKFGSRRPYPDVSTTHGAKSGDATGVYFRTRRIFYTARYSIACTLSDAFDDEIYPRNGRDLSTSRAHSWDRSYLSKEAETRRRDKFLRLCDSAINISVRADVRRFAFHVVPSLFSSAPFVTAHITETRKRLCIWYEYAYAKKKKKKREKWELYATLFRVIRRAMAAGAFITFAYASPYLF